MATEGYEKLKEECPDIFWQLVSNAILCDKKKAELMLYVPYKDELKLIRDENEWSKFLAPEQFEDKNFKWFLSTRFLSQFATMGFSFYIIYALRHFNMDAVTAGFLTATLTISQTIGNISMGWIGDRIGQRAMLILGAFAALFSSILAWNAVSITWFYPIFFLAGLANVSIWTIGMAMTVNFGTEAERPHYIGLSQTLTAPATIIAPLIGGWIVDSAGFIPTFSISIVLSIVMIGILLFLVKDPRIHLTVDERQ